MKTKTREILTSSKPLSYKLQYFWEYNNKIILFIIFILALIGTGIYQAINNPPAPTISIAVVGEDKTLAEIQQLKARDHSKIANLLKTTEKKQVDYVSRSDVAANEKYTARLTASELTLILTDGKQYKQLAKGGELVNLKKKASIASLVTDDDYSILLTTVDSRTDPSLNDFRFCIPKNAEKTAMTIKELAKLK